MGCFSSVFSLRMRLHDDSAEIPFLLLPESANAANMTASYPAPLADRRRQRVFVLCLGSQKAKKTALPVSSAVLV